MINVFFELDRLRSGLEAKGVEPNIIRSIISKARKEIEAAAAQEGEAAMQSAISIGVEKRAPDFINELRLDTVNFELETESGNMDFSEPPYPMLSYLLKNAKPMADGSGVYKVIPVGKPGNRPPISTNIHDAQKKIAVQRTEEAKKRYEAISPAGSKNTQFRTVTSKMDPSKQWVQPAKEKNFASDVKQINTEMQSSLNDTIKDIIRNYLELF